MATVEQVDAVLHIYSTRHADFPAKDADENRTIAREFVQHFVKFVSKEYGLTLKPVEQGSAFEELKVGKPDEFDFMLVIDHSDLFDPPTSNAKDTEIAAMKKTQGQLKWLLNRYHRITTRQAGSSGSGKARWVEAMVEQWPGTGEQCLSAQKTITTFREYLQTFARTSAANKIQGVSAVEPPTIDSPALTTILQKADTSRSKISIHLSPALTFPKSKRGDTGPDYYVAEQSVPELAGVDKAKLQLLWLGSFSQAEKKLIQNKTTDDRRNYRMVKRLFDEEVADKYIWKTIFMKRDKPFPSSPLLFLMEMLEDFEKALYSEQEERKWDAEGRSNLPGGSLESDPDQKYLLLSKFNEYENVLARYSDREIKDFLKKFQHYIGPLQFGGYCDLLLDKPQLGELCELCGDDINTIYKEAKDRRNFTL